MSITNQGLLEAAEGHGWTVSTAPLNGRDAVRAHRGPAAVAWYTRNRVQAVWSLGGKRVSSLKSRADVLAILESAPESLRPAVAYLQATLGATVIEYQTGHRQPRFIERPQDTEALRRHLAADHGANPLAMDKLFISPALVHQQHDLWHQVFQAPAWPYINPHHHADMSSMSAATLLETT